MSRRWIALALVAVATRALWFALEGGMHYPDEIFQYLEPAHWRITGDAFLPWEIERGARSWLIPAFWGGWMEIGRALGLHRWELHRFLTFHAAMLSALVVPAAYGMARAAARSQRAGLLAAWFAALLPALGYFAPHTLSELPTMLLLGYAHVAWLRAGDLRAHSSPRDGFLAGALLGLAVACRVPSALSMIVFAGDLLVRRRIDALRALLVGFSVAIVLVGIVDAATWGSPWQSIFVFVRWNAENDRALDAAHLAEPWHFYAASIWRTLGLGGPALVALSLWAARRNARLFIAWSLPVIALSTVANKQDRFLLPLLPVLLAGAAAGLVDLVALTARTWRWRRSTLIALAAAAILLPATFAAARLPRRAWAGTFRAEAWIGAQGAASGVLVDGGENANGGYLLLERSIPLAPYNAELARHALFDHVIAATPRLIARMREDPHFEEIADFEGTLVFRRRQR